MRCAVFKREFDSVKNFRRSLFTCGPTRRSSRVLPLRRRGVLLLRAPSAPLITLASSTVSLLTFFIMVKVNDRFSKPLHYRSVKFIF